tara:strand:- start:257 stop:586 length:330 start_codon:yes stop_codon:yes gene_type:complete
MTIRFAKVSVLNVCENMATLTTKKGKTFLLPKAYHTGKNMYAFDTGDDVYLHINADKTQAVMVSPIKDDSMEALWVDFKIEDGEVTITEVKDVTKEELERMGANGTDGE